METESIKLRVQATLDELFSQHLIPFELTAYKVNEDGPGEYVVPFYDSRIHSIRFALKDDGSFKEVVRAAVLDAVLDHVNTMSANRMSGTDKRLMA